MLKITSDIFIDIKELSFKFVCSSGPGGQNVNKVATAAQLRFNLLQSPGLPDEVRQRATKLAGRQLNQEGELVIEAKRHRTAERNRQDAIKRLVGLLQQAAIIPKKRKKTKISKAAKERRLKDKKHRSELKQTRML